MDEAIHPGGGNVSGADKGEVNCKIYYFYFMEPAHISHYNKALQKFANTNRKNSTKGEVCLWKYVLKAKQMKGYAFNRQRPVLNYIADFMCKPLMLIIEVDGNTHDENETKEKDIIKTHDLENAGYIVLRFTDDDVLKNIELVKKEIEGVVLKLENRNLPHP